MEQFLILLAIGGLGMLLILPIASMIMLSKVRREQQSGLADLQRELRALRRDIKGQEIVAGARPGVPRAPTARACGGPSAGSQSV